MPRGALTMVFDDGYQEVYDEVLPLLRRFGIRAVFAVPVETAHITETERTPTVTFEAWKAACARDGHELAAHGVTHRPLTILSDPELRDELDASAKAAAAITLVYPGGAHDARVAAEARRRFCAARTIHRGLESLLPPDPHRLRSFVATTENFRTWFWNLRVVWAWLTNQWIIETFHQIQAPSDRHSVRNPHTIPLDLLNQHLRFVVRLPIRLATIRDIVHAGRPHVCASRPS